MEKMLFRRYGVLDWLSPEEYCADKWKYLHYAYGADEKKYDIVEKDDEYRYTKLDEYRYTNIQEVK